MSPLKNFYDLAATELGWGFYLVMIAVTIVFAVKKEWTRALSFLVGCLVLSVVVFTPEKWKELGIKLWGVLFPG
ncbi:hypothetical protein M5X00_24275 [Paenibacillus alvei]|uniref:Uncharacterized protein n=1 Tax=Paenibacillus alvei TaxID=44250 RepID=A0ABT4H7H3_PAEAL|nr:hypothetical protein [Paenibacillus alvei]EJW14348.1 hypothetical protein PAV_14c00410 [Paenibacillus alvei DSM 29]MCY9542837.1 hypothetical protein [Paenibacillus alvei]MCY9736108.1 hypothetical protein [Paenibacillus alvei]MCY9757347.1 hypothetical protein [Paenibacillus alvei]MCY9764914.1 hypothetical protein [Paenibacillus alvei]